MFAPIARFNGAVSAAKLHRPHAHTQSTASLAHDGTALRLKLVEMPLDGVRQLLRSSQISNPDFVKLGFSAENKGFLNNIDC